jgi:hypothetical protein
MFEGLSIIIVQLIVCRSVFDNEVILSWSSNLNYCIRMYICCYFYIAYTSFVKSTNVLL